MTYGRREPDRPAEKNFKIGLRVPGDFGQRPGKGGHDRRRCRARGMRPGRRQRGAGDGSGAPPASAVVSGTVTARPGAYCTADRLAEALFAPPKVMLPRTLMRYSSRPGWSKA